MVKNTNTKPRTNGGNGNALATAEQNHPPVLQGQVMDKNTVADLLHSPYLQASLEVMLPRHMTPEKLVKIVMVAVSRNQGLLKCTKDSLLQAVMDAAKLGLPPDGTLGQGYLVPFWNGKARCLEAKFIAGYRGYITLARNSGNIESISAELVYAGEKFNIKLGTAREIVHERSLDVEPTDENITGAYMIARFKDGGYHFEYMTRKQLEAVKERSPSKNKQGEVVGPWVSDFGEMCRKTVVRRGIKMVPMSVEEPIAKLVEHDNATDGVVDMSGLLQLPEAPTTQEVIDGTATNEAEDRGAESQLPAGETQNEQEPGQQPEPEPQGNDEPQSGAVNNLW